MVNLWSRGIIDTVFHMYGEEKGPKGSQKKENRELTKFGKVNEITIHFEI